MDYAHSSSTCRKASTPTGSTWRLLDKHTVTVRVKTISLRNCMLVSRAGEFASGECADQHQQTRLGQVEVRQHRTRPAKLKPRMDEQIRLAAHCAQRPS